MAESHNVQVTRRAMQAVNDYNFDLVHKLVTDDIVVEQPFPAMGQPERYQSRETFIGGLNFIPTMFKEFKLTISDIYDCPEENAVVFEQTSKGIFNIDGSPFANRYLMIFEFRDGKIAKWVEHYNPKVMTDLMTPVVAKMDV